MGEESADTVLVPSQGERLVLIALRVNVIGHRNLVDKAVLSQKQIVCRRIRKEAVLASEAINAVHFPVSNLLPLVKAPTCHFQGL